MARRWLLGMCEVVVYYVIDVVHLGINEER